MKHFHTLTCNFSFGMIGDQIKEAIDIAKITGRQVRFEFSKVEIEVTSESNEVFVYEEYERRRKDGVK